MVEMRLMKMCWHSGAGDGDDGHVVLMLVSWQKERELRWREMRREEKMVMAKKMVVEVGFLWESKVEREERECERRNRVVGFVFSAKVT